MTLLKRCSIFAFALMLTLQIQAQVSIGVRGGINFGSVSEPAVISKILPDFQNIIGTNIALVAEIGITDQFAIQPELAFAQKGFNIKQGLYFELFNIPLGVGIKATTKVNYLEMPVLAKVKFGNDRVQSYLTAGPVLGYATSGRFKTKAQIIFDIPVLDRKLDLDALGYNRFEFSASVGGGVAFNTGNGSLFIDARYVHGLTNVYDVPIVDLKLKNKGFGINIGYMMPLTSGPQKSRILYP